MNNKLACAILLSGTLACLSLKAIKENPDQTEKQVSTEISLKETKTATSLEKSRLATLSKIIKDIPANKETKTATSLAKGLFGTLAIIFGGQAVGNYLRTHTEWYHIFDEDGYRIYDEKTNKALIGYRILGSSTNTILFTQVATQLFLLSCLWKQVTDELNTSKNEDIHQNKSTEIAKQPS